MTLHVTDGYFGGKTISLQLAQLACAGQGTVVLTSHRYIVLPLILEKDAIIVRTAKRDRTIT